MTIRPRRSMLFMPGSNARAIEKARSLPCDGVILDLEDGVAPDAKDSARQQVRDAVAAKGFGYREVLIRINGIDTPWWIADVDAAAQAHPHAIVLPKVSGLHELSTLANRLIDIGADQKIRVWAMIETPMAVLHVHHIAAEAAKDVELRLSGLVMGTNDLAKETHSRIVPGRAPVLPWLTSCILVAHAYKLAILDGVYNDIQDADGFRQECVQGRDMGFDGKTLIHPGQIEACNAAFAPTADEIDQARKVIAAFEQPEQKDKGVIALEGRMVERLHLDMARRTVEIADAIAAAQG